MASRCRRLPEVKSNRELAPGLLPKHAKVETKRRTKVHDDVAHGTATNLERTIENPVTGERYTFLATAEEKNGELLKLKEEIPAGTSGAPLHYHLTFTEGFEVLEGGLDLRVGEDHLVLGSGESATVPLGTPHRFWNSSDEPAVFEAEIRPARKMEQSLRVMVGLARDGKTNDKGVPENLFELALLYELSESYIVGMPLFLQK